MTGDTHRPFGPRLTHEDADRIMRNPGMGWPADLVEEARDLRGQALREGLGPMPPHLTVTGPTATERLERRAQLRGIIQGLALAALALGIVLGIAATLDAHWPVACDGTGSAAACTIRILGVV
ncbi:hypothetical protein [Paracoccus sp. ME4]|uniref:hypothetical protein n=1 Tax=Paracoccus sp. ME4 TaxID=3138066 RepID=UPI00398B4A4F